MLDPFLTRLDQALTITENRNKLLTELNSFLQSLLIPANLIGGMALATYGYIRNTEDIDILIHQHNYSKLAQALTDKGAKPEPNNKYKLNNTYIQIYYGGQQIHKNSPDKFPEPTTNTPGLTVIELPQLLAMKVQAGYSRAKDRADYIELIKRGSIPITTIETEVLPLLTKSGYKQLAKQLWKQAIIEPL